MRNTLRCTRSFYRSAINAALQARVNRSFTMPHRGLQRLTNRCAFALFTVKHELNHKGVFMLRSLVVGVVTVSLSGAASAQSLWATPDPAPQTRTTVLAAAQPELPPNPVTGFIEFLFGEPARQAQRGSRQWFGAPPQQDYSRDEQDGRVAYANAPPDDQVLDLIRASCARRSPITERKRPAPSSSIRQIIFCIWSGPEAGPFATASVSPDRDFHGQGGTR